MLISKITCDLWTRLNIKSILYMHDSIQNITKNACKNCFQEYLYFDSFKGERDHSDHPGHSETLTTPTTRKKWTGTMSCLEKFVWNNNLQKKVVCKDLQSLKKIIQSICKKCVLKNQEWFTKLQKLSCKKNLQKIDPERLRLHCTFKIFNHIFTSTASFPREALSQRPQIFVWSFIVSA